MRGKSTKKSFIKEILIYLSLLTGLLFVLLGVFLLSSYDILEKEIIDSSDAFLEIYSNEFDNSVEKMNDVLKRITMQGEDLANIKSESENRRSLASISLHNYMQETISGTELVDMIIVYDSNYNVCLDANGTSIKYEDKNVLRTHTMEILTDTKIENAEWNFITVNNNVYLYKPLRYGGRVIAVYTQMKDLLPTLETDVVEGRSIILTDRNGRIGKMWGDATLPVRVGGDITDIDEKDYHRKRVSVAEDTLYMYCFTWKNAMLKQTHTSMILVAVVVCASVLFLLYILRYTRKEVILPMQTMVEDMECIKNGAYDARISGNFDTKEFLLLQETTNQMVDEIVGLKIRAYEEQIELQGMELKSIRLQLKPHFFLNALTTISSLSNQNKNEKIQDYINALSKNVRYMFRAGFHTVSVKEEIRHVENYFEMQELKYPGCIFYMIDLPEQLEEWQIPQMLIHTFIENEYKYAISMEETLTVLIKISEQRYQGEDMLVIEIEDDGKGYPEEVLAYMNDIAEPVGAKGERIGLRSIKRMMELMYEKKELVQLSNIEPHGCMNRIYVPKEPKHALEEETIQKTI